MRQAPHALRLFGRQEPAYLVDGSVERARQELARHFGPSKLKVDEKDCEAFRNDASEAEGDLPASVVLADTPRDL